jgi:site-specific recombinase XerD
VNALTNIDHAAAIPAVFEDEIALAADFAAASKSPNTLKAYKSDLRAFITWCDRRGLTAIPADPSTIAAFLASEAQAGRKPSTIGRRLAAIRWGHETAGVLRDDQKCPTADKRVTAVLGGIRRAVGAAPRQKKPLTADLVLGAVATMPRQSLRDKRDVALLLLAFGGAFRCSEVAALNVEDIEFCDAGMRVTIRKSKTDQLGVGTVIAIAAGSIACPALAVKAWFEAANITTGPAFRQIKNPRRQLITEHRLHSRNISLLVKTLVGRLGLNEADYSAHSCRAGWISSAAARGASVFKMKEVSRHKSLEVLSGYVRNADLFRDHAGSGLL